MVAVSSRYNREFVTVAFLIAILVGSVIAARVADASQSSQDIVEHPVVGVWLTMVPGAPGEPTVAAPTMFTADGRVVLMGQVTEGGPDGVRWSSDGIGAWERTGERSAEFTIVRVLSDGNGAYLGTLTTQGTLTVSDDGATATDTSPASSVILHDPAGNIVRVIEGHRDLNPVTATRISVTSRGFQVGPECGNCGPLDS